MRGSLTRGGGAVTTLVLALLVAGAAVAEADRHALLIGIAAYPPGNQLQGPPHDVAALKQVLTRSWGVAPEQVTTLINAAATRENILAAIDALQAQTQPGDQIFLFFSGHGTSAFDERMVSATGARLDPWSGALVPYGFAGEQPQQELIIGSRDLKPRLARLDRDRSLFVVFDACYSQFAVRSIADREAVRAYRFWRPGSPSRTRSAVSSSRGAFDEALARRKQEGPLFVFAAADPGYPYANTVYLAAAAREETAREIRRQDLARYPTLDGQPHGALSNALLRGLRGEANRNGDDRITYQELYAFVRETVAADFTQTPQVLAPEGTPDLLRTPVLGMTRAIPSPPGIDPALRRQILALPGVVLASGEVDLEVAAGSASYRLLHPSGDLYEEVKRGAEATLLARIRGRCKLQGLIELAYPGQSNNVYLEVPGKRGFLQPGSRFRIELASELPVHLLLLAIDPSGMVSVLYPINQAELAATRSATISDLVVEPPCGTEQLELVGFVEAPEGLLGLSKAPMDPLGPGFDGLLGLLQESSAGRAATGLKLVTVEP